MLRGLAYIGNQGIVHRDIKPQNILVDLSNMRVMICDFGSAKIIGSQEKSISYICSRYYRAPELILNKEYYGPEIDLWSIGCVMAEFYTAQPLFWGNNSEQQFLKIMALLGTPSLEEMQEMEIPNLPSLPAIQGRGLESVLSKQDPLAVDLLKQLLQFSPK